MKKINLLLSTILIPALLLYSCANKTNTASTNTNVKCIVKNTTTSQAASDAVKLLPPADNKIYFSAFPGFGEDENIVETNRITDFETLAGKNITWASFSQYWYEGITYPQEKIHTINNEGIVPLVRIQPRSTTEEYKKETTFTLQNIIDGKYDNELRSWALAAKADNIPIMIDFGVEMNGKWFPWNGYWNGGGTTDEYGDKSYPDGPERYRDSYRHIIELFRAESVNHISWVFHATMHTTEPNESWNDPKCYYPGDNYIDWIGASIYGPLYPKQNYWDSFNDVLTSNDSYKKILEISNTKPFAVFELGVTDNHPLGSKKEWLEGAFQSILNATYIKFQAVNYWHEDWDNDGSMTTLKIDSSAEVLETFKNEISNPRFSSTAVFSNTP